HHQGVVPMMLALAAISRWTAFILVLAAVAHAAALSAIPGMLMSRAMALAAEDVGVNNMAFPAPADAAGTDQVVASCVFNLSQNEVPLTIPKPATGTWSVTLYGEDARPFFFHESAPGDAQTLDAILVEPGGPPPNVPGVTLIEPPNFTGLILVR